MSTTLTITQEKKEITITVKGYFNGDTSNNAVMALHLTGFKTVGFNYKGDEIVTDGIKNYKIENQWSNHYQYEMEITLVETKNQIKKYYESDKMDLEHENMKEIVEMAKIGLKIESVLTKKQHENLGFYTNTTLCVWDNEKKLYIDTKKTDLKSHYSKLLNMKKHGLLKTVINY